MEDCCHNNGSQCSETDPCPFHDDNGWTTEHVDDCRCQECYEGRCDGQAARRDDHQRDE